MKLTDFLIIILIAMLTLFALFIAFWGVEND